MSTILNILLVEDNKNDAILLEQCLRDANIQFESHRVDNEEDYLAGIRNNPDIIISDFSLPQFDGLRALSLLKQEDKDIPFILVSGKIGEETAVEAMKAGASDYIMKDNLTRLPSAVLREIEESTTRRHYKTLQEQYQKLVTLSPDAIFIQSEGKFVFVNQAGCELLSAQSPEQILGRSIYDFIHTDYHSLVASRIKAAEDKNEIAELKEEKFIDLNQRIVEVEVLAAPFVYDGKPATQVFVRNISSRKRAEEKIKNQNLQLKKHIARNQRLKYADLMKSEFLATMSHELRTPMNAIIGFSEVMKDGLVGTLTDKQKQYCTDIYKSGQHLLALINDILDLSKIDAGKMDCILEEIDILPLLIDCISVLKEKALSYGVEFKLETDVNLGQWNFDQRKLKQILYNLLSNAVKFSPSGSIIILRAVVTNENMLEISVSDKGDGISQDNLKLLFQPFEQIRQSQTSRDKGTGLGLMIAKRLVELHSGSIKVESVLGKGTRFIVTLPYLPLSQNVLLRAKSSVPASKDRAYAPCALVIEDDPKGAELVKLQLQELGIEMIWKQSAEEALGCDFDEIPDLIILDILLPGMSGIEMMNALKTHKVLSDVPVMIVSVAADENKTSIVNAVDILQKPLGRHQLADAIKKFVKNDTYNKKIKILLADDEPASFEILTNALQDINCEVIYAADGSEALDQISQARPDIIVLDLFMPKVDGFAVLEQLKNNESTADIPVIIVTSKNLTEHEQQYLRANVVQVMKKDSLLQEQFRREIKRIVLN